MNLEQLRQKLLAAARAHPPDDRVPYAFEKRILARLKEQPALDWAAFWSRSLWRAAVPCVAITLLLLGWSFFGAGKHAVTATTTVTPTTIAAARDPVDFSQRFEQTMLAAVEEPEVVW